jgi:hypothetical protein
MMTRRARLAAGLVVIVPLAGLAALAACGGEDGGVDPSVTPADETGTGTETGTGSESSTVDGPATDGPSSQDAASDADPISDGGSNVDLDGGDDDAGDGGSCNALANDAPAITSTCISLNPPLNGGALVPGKYYLVGVTALASPSFCQNQFVATGFKQTVDLTVSGAGVGTAQTVTALATGNARRRTATFTPGAGNTSPLTATTICPVGDSGNAAYASAVINGTQTLILRLAYGSGQALYRYRKQ